jgi:polyisoprenoid-binding protein YceI
MKLFNLLKRRFVMKRIIYSLLFIFLLGPIQAVAQQWELDTAHTNFYFEVKHTYVAVRGQFMDFSGDVYFDPENLANNKFDFVINVNSIDTKIGKRDTHLRSPDFFDAGKYPLITFKSSNVSHAGKNKYIVEGVLTIKDVSKKLELEFIYYGQKENPIKPGQIVAGLDSRLMLDRLEYNVGDGKFYKMGIVDKDVNILIVLELLRDK